MTLFKGIIWLDLFWISLTRLGHIFVPVPQTTVYIEAIESSKRKLLTPELTYGFN